MEKDAGHWMADPITITISALALGISSATAWLTLFRRGTIRMTQPTTIYFGPDRPSAGAPPHAPKVYLRTLLFSTAKRGHVVEAMHITLARNEARQTFNVWVHGDERLVRGSGLYVGETGVAANHHFLVPRDGTKFAFLEGRYRLEVYARLVGRKALKKLFSQDLRIDLETAMRLQEPHVGLFFDWGPESGGYLQHVATRDTDPSSEVVAAIRSLTPSTPFRA